MSKKLVPTVGRVRKDIHRKSDNPKLKLRPGLSITGKELRTRLRNNSIGLQSPGLTEYNTDEAIEATRRMTKGDLINASREQAAKVSELKSKLANSKVKK